MSPEQVKERALNHQTDIYSLGVVMYQLLAGRLPFQATNNFSLIYQIANVEPQPPSSYRPQIPATLDAIVKRAMAKDLARRYASWEDFSLELAEVFRNEGLGGRKETFADSDKFESLRKLLFFTNFTDAELWEVARISTPDAIRRSPRPAIGRWFRPACREAPAPRLALVDRRRSAWAIRRCHSAGWSRRNTLHRIGADRSA
jgi:serine/threonine protein kinase